MGSLKRMINPGTRPLPDTPIKSGIKLLMTVDCWNVILTKINPTQVNHRRDRQLRIRLMRFQSHNL